MCWRVSARCNAEVDETKLTLALSNLVENAIKYNKEGGWVHVSLNVDNKYFYVKVEIPALVFQKSHRMLFLNVFTVWINHTQERSAEPVWGLQSREVRS